MSDNWGAPAPQQDQWAEQQPPSPSSGWGSPAALSQPPAAAVAPPTSDEMMGAPSVPSFSFDGVSPIRCGGVITELPVAIQQRDFHDQSKPLSWPDGKPKWAWPVFCQTTDRDVSIQDDDGVRAFYLSYKRLDAVKKAVQAAGMAKLEVGGTLWLEWYDMSGKTKLYRAQYSPPGAPAPTPVAQAPAAPVADPWQGLNSAAVAELRNHGLLPHQVLPHIQHREGWQGAPAAQILTVVPRPAVPVDDSAPPF